MKEADAVQQRVDWDWFLQALITIKNDKDFAWLHMPVTLLVGGSIISGELVGGEQYFREIAAEVKDAFMKVEGIRGFADQYSESFTQAGKDLYKEGTQQGPPHMIHLREARIFQPGAPAFPSNGVWWRGRLEAVDGFIFGGVLPSTSD